VHKRVTIDERYLKPVKRRGKLVRGGQTSESAPNYNYTLSHMHPLS
jgi:hypothetical protein